MWCDWPFEIHALTFPPWTVTWTHKLKQPLSSLTLLMDRIFYHSDRNGLGQCCCPCGYARPVSSVLFQVQYVCCWDEHPRSLTPTETEASNVSRLCEGVSMCLPCRPRHVHVIDVCIVMPSLQSGWLVYLPPHLCYYFFATSPMLLFLSLSPLLRKHAALLADSKYLICYC